MLPGEEASAAARAVAVMVRVHGPDPKGRKMRNHAFHHSESGDTTLSASGLLLQGVGQKIAGDYPSSDSVVLTCSSIVEPFLAKQPAGGPYENLQNMIALIPGAEIDILIESLNEGQPSNGSSHCKSSPCWLPVKLVTLVDIPSAGSALQSLLDMHGGSVDGSWEVGWALALTETSRSHQGLGFSSYKDLMQVEGLKNDLASATTRLAVLSVHIKQKMIASALHLAVGCKKGGSLLVVGSPFGALSPLHFFNSLVAGIISNCWPPFSPRPSLLMADLRCLPGMEGSPAFDGKGALVGLLVRPLRQRGGGAEVQLVITWDAIAPHLREFGIDIEAGFLKTHHSPLPSLADANERTVALLDTVEDDRVQGAYSLDDAVESVVLVSVGGAWASGVIINEQGLILTNAHLLEPWRFGKAQLSQGEREVSALENASNDMQIATMNSRHLLTQLDCSNGIGKLAEQTRRDLYFQAHEQDVDSGAGVIPQAALEINYRSYRKIRIRLGQSTPQLWYSAKVVYISRGPLDIALLQLEHVPLGLRPVKPERQCPCPGMVAIVIGHGLFGPRSELYPSLSSGVVSRVVMACNMLQLQSSEREIPAMLETTAAVHPGGSGGAVVNQQGLLIGLVTSNARHSGGTVIPHLNFSIPFAALEPIFAYADGDMDTSLLNELNMPNEQLAAVWALVPPSPPRPTQVMPVLPKLPGANNPTTELKGSRFAKFLLEKKVNISSQTPELYERHGQLSKKWLVENLEMPSVPGQTLHSRM